MNIDQMMAVDAPPVAEPAKTIKNGTPYVSSKNQNAKPAAEVPLSDLVKEAFKPRPTTVPGEQNPTVLVRERQNEEPAQKQAELPKAESEEQPHKPDPRVLRKEALKKSVSDVWSKLPVPEGEQKPANKPETAKEGPSADASSEGDVFGGAKENDWKAAKAAAKQRQEELNRKIQELESREAKAAEELAKYRQATADPLEISRLKEEHKKALDRLALLDYQSHPEYRKNFVEPKEALKAQVNQILSDNGIEGFDVESILSKPRIEYAKAMSDLEDRLNSYDAGEVRATMRDLQKLNEASKNAIGKHSEIAQALRQQSEIKNRQAFEEVLKENQVWLLKPYEIPEGLEPEEKQNLESFNQAVSQVRAQAERYAFSPADEKTSASLAFKAAQYDVFTNHAIPRMVKDYQAAKETIAELTEQLKQLQAKKPGVVDSGSANGSSQPSSEKPLSIKEMVRQTYRRQ